MSMNRRTFIALATGGVAAMAVGSASAATYPTRPVRIIVPFAPGGPPDIVARIVAEKLSERLGQRFFVENLPGGGGNAGTATAQRAVADGHTLLVISTGFFVNPSLYTDLPYDPVKGFAPISLLTTSPNVVMVAPDLPVGSLKELIDRVKANPGKYAYSHPGIGSTPHLSGEMLKLQFQLELAAVPFNAGPPAIQSTMGGHTQIAITALPSALPFVRSGKVRALAVTSSRRDALLPDVPTMAEAGVPDHEAETLNGILAPAGTPPAVVDRLYGEVEKVMADAGVAPRLTNIGFEPIVTTPAEFGRRIQSEIAKWAKVIHETGITPKS